MTDMLSLRKASSLEGDGVRSEVQPWTVPVPVTHPVLAFQLVRSASFSRGGQMTFTHGDPPLPGQVQASFGFQTFQPSGVLLQLPAGVWTLRESRTRFEPDSRFGVQNNRERLSVD